MVLQVHQRCRVTLLAREEMFINPQHLRTGSARELRDALLNKRLIPALHGGAANAMRARELALAHTAFMRFKDFQSVGFGGAQARQNAAKAVAEISVAPWAMVFRHPQVQDHDPVALTGVLEGASVRSFDAHALVLAMDAGRARRGTRPDMNILVALHALYY